MAMTLRLSEEQTERLRITAERENTSMHNVAVRAVEQYTTRRAARRDELLARILDEDSDVLTRLGDA